jgi:hypothetical protein
MEEKHYSSLKQKIREYIVSNKELPTLNNSEFRHIFYYLKYRSDLNLSWSMILEEVVSELDLKESKLFKNDLKSRKRVKWNMENITKILANYMIENRQLPRAMDLGGLYNSNRLYYKFSDSFLTLLANSIDSLHDLELKQLMTRQLIKREPQYNKTDWTYDIAQSTYHVLNYIQEHNKIPTTRELYFICAHLYYQKDINWNEFLVDVIKRIPHKKLRVELLVSLNSRIKKYSWHTSDGLELAKNQIMDFMIRNKKIPSYSDLKSLGSALSRYKHIWGITSRWELMRLALDQLKQEITDEKLIVKLEIDLEDRINSYKNR